MAFRPDGQRLASGCSDGAIALWNVGDPEHTYLKNKLYGHTDRVLMVIFNADGTRIASASADHTICVWDAVTYQRLLTLLGQLCMGLGL